MSSRNDRNIQPTMLIITRSIYAKRSNDAFYTGNIETKLPDGSYLVKFMDGASESVEERDIMWLGFWGLPPWTWPRNPIVQSAGPANVDFLNGLVQNENTKEPIPNSVPFNTLFREADVGDNERRDNDFSELDIKADVSTRTEMRNTEELDSVEQMSAHVLPRESSESKNQTRVSVLRMYCSGYLKQETKKNEDELHSTEHEVESPVFRRSPHADSLHCEEKKCFTFGEDCTALKMKNDLNVRKRKIYTPEHEECSSSEKYPKLENIENKYRNASPAQKHYPAHLPPFLSSHRQNYSHPFGISMYDAPSPPIPTSFRLHARVRRRSENKKCRKVYGIENRDIWCTQCKWKKACTRFTSTDKDDGPGLMYITDYEGMPYPV